MIHAVIQKLLSHPHLALFSEALYTHTDTGWYLQKIAFWISAPQQVSQEVQWAVRWGESSGKTERSISAVLPGQETVSKKEERKRNIMIKSYEHLKSYSTRLKCENFTLCLWNIKLMTCVFSKEI